MSSHYPPLSCDEVKTILSNLGFSARPKKEGRGSHENWVKREGNKLRKVTVDCPKAPFSQELIKWMRLQAGVTKKQFYEALNAKKETKKGVRRKGLKETPG